ncbi:MAG: polysaccharide biosynthesis C-terminal domain-containing protein [Bacteroidales bacterium]|nr:polysaccharide biosynthesis C-terminal domain-containing protein [Bacteroidales bacterium]
MAEKQMKKLAKETAIYGVSSILGKFLNWLLVPLYTYVLESSADYGIVTNLYSWTALLLVILTYGMETGFFRFANKNKENAGEVYSTTLISVGTTSFIFASFCVLFSQQIANALGYNEYPEYITMLGIVVAIDAFASIPFAYLRFINRPVKFAAIKFLYIALNIVFNLFFLVGCPWLMEHAPSTIDWFYNPHYGVGYVFVSNILSTLIQTLALIPYIFAAKLKFNHQLLRKILQYSLPLLVLGVAGIMNQTLDKILYPFLKPGVEGAAELGIYGATSKIAMVMLMFTQAFRYAYEPFIFAQHKDKNSLSAYADAMKFFIIFSLLIFLGMTLYMDIFKYIIQRDYWTGLNVVPIVLMSFIFQGIFFNLSLWYKLTDKTMYGAWFSILGTIIIVIGNVLLVPRFGYTGSAWAAFACYFVIMLVSYYFGQKYMPIKYDLKTIGLYTLVTIILYVISLFIDTPYPIVNIALKTVLMIAFLALLVKRDFPLKNIPILKRYIK